MRGAGVLGAATTLYQSESAHGEGDARAIARELSAQAGLVRCGPQRFGGQSGQLAGQAGLARVVVRSGTRRVLADVGSPSAVAPGEATVRVSG